MKQQTVKPQELKSIRAVAKELQFDQVTLWRFIKRTPTIHTYRIGQILAVSPGEVKQAIAKLEASGKRLGYPKQKVSA